MEMNLLQTFKKVAELESISKAADDMYLSVSTVTGRIKALEEELNVDLFYRSGRRFELSEEGRRFLSYVDRFLNLIEDGTQKVTMSREGRAGELSLAVCPIVASYVLPRFIRVFREHYSEIQLRVITCPNYQVIEKVNNGQAELGIMYGDPEESGLTVKLWFEDQWVMVSPNRTIGKEKALNPEALSEHPFLAYRVDQHQWGTVLEWYKTAGLRPKVVMELEHVETLKNVMDAFQAVSFLPRMSVLDELQQHKFVEVPITPSIEARSKIAFAIRPNHQLTVTAHTLLHFAADYAAKFFRLGGI